jgi:uncharacterized protein (DUF1810 family)
MIRQPVGEGRGYGLGGWGMNRENAKARRGMGNPAPEISQAAKKWNACITDKNGGAFMTPDIVEKLAQFVAAQEGVYDQVVRELTAGRKRSHWIWFIFPQMARLGFSQMSWKFGIESKEEAIGYLEHGVLGSRLRECTRLMLAAPHRDIGAIMGYPDDLKFRSSMTLFAEVAPEETCFSEALEKFFGGERDERTLEWLRGVGESGAE